MIHWEFVFSDDSILATLKRIYLMFNPTCSKIVIKERREPKQQDNSSCGIFCIGFLDYFLHQIIGEERLILSQDMVQQIRYNFLDCLLVNLLDLFIFSKNKNKIKLNKKLNNKNYRNINSNKMMI